MYKQRLNGKVINDGVSTLSFPKDPDMQENEVGFMKGNEVTSEGIVDRKLSQYYSLQQNTPFMLFS